MLRKPDQAHQKTRFEPTRWNRAWSALKVRLTPASHPSTTSESAMGSSYGPTDQFYQESVGQGSTVAALELLNPRGNVYGKHKKKPALLRARTKPKSSGANSNSRFGDDEDVYANHEPVSHIVVDNDFEHFIPSAPRSDGGSTTKTPHSASQNKTEATGDGTDQEETGSSPRDDTSVHPGKESWIKQTRVYEFLFGSIWPAIHYFFDSSFPEPQKEKSFQKEQAALIAGGYYIVSWALTVGLQNTPWSSVVWGGYFGVGLVCLSRIQLIQFFTLPIFPMVVFDVPRRHNWIWQIWLFCATWLNTDTLIVEMNLCGFFNAVNNCGTRTFLNLMGSAMSTPVLAIFALGQSRLFHLAGAVIWLCLIGGLVMTMDNYPQLFYRNIVVFALFHAFLIGTSYLKERSDRQMFALRQQLKIQYRATQSAQVMERRAADSKKRFVSYIFHEVRVPLNTALLAVQNLDGEEVFKGLPADQAEMVHGLMGSLTMMEKVLNDVLSFNRMESGKFAQARKPFEFHKSIQLVALSHRMQAQMAGIDLIVELDKDIDKIGGMFVGDEMRLRQVTSNLVSNSIKFTDKGSVRIVTKLLYPRMEPTPATEIDDPLRQAAINSGKFDAIPEIPKVGNYADGDPEKGSVHLELEKHNAEAVRQQEEKNRHKAVVRVEVHDTGVGLKKQDVIDNRLFSPYVQTEIGRRQGGKGSGLGLALVRQIVKLSNGRLGVESEAGKGSMFWFELPYSLPSRKKNDALRESPLLLATPRLSLPSSPNMPLTATITQIPRLSVPDIATTPIAATIHQLAENPPILAATTRPSLGTTESRAPLLGVPTSPNEETILSTFAPVGGSAPTPPDGKTPIPDPFKQVQPVERKPSDASSSATKLDSPARNIPPPSPEAPLCTLVVDDDKLTRMLMSRMLQRLGHQVTTAENGKIALDMIKASWEQLPNSPRFDVVFLDNQMPLMSGVEVAREVRLMGCPLFIVGCTGNALREDQDEYIGAGADGIIPKPIHQKSVMEMIKEARRRVAGETQPKEIEEEDNA